MRHYSGLLTRGHPLDDRRHRGARPRQPVHRRATPPRSPRRINGLDDFELVAFLAIVDPPGTDCRMTGAPCTGGRRPRSSAASSPRPSSTSTPVSRPPCARSSSPRSSASPGPTSSPTRPIHLRGNAAVPEIQVFVIDAKDDDVSDDVLTAIDKAIQFPIIFEINRGSGTQARRRDGRCPQGSSAARSQRLSDYFSTDWHPPTRRAPRCPSLLTWPASTPASRRQCCPSPPGQASACRRRTARMDQARKLEREIAALREDGFESSRSSTARSSCAESFTTAPPRSPHSPTLQHRRSRTTPWTS